MAARLMFHKRMLMAARLMFQIMMMMACDGVPRKYRDMCWPIRPWLEVVNTMFSSINYKPMSYSKCQILCAILEPVG